MEWRKLPHDGDLLSESGDQRELYTQLHILKHVIYVLIALLTAAGMYVCASAPAKPMPESSRSRRVRPSARPF